MEESRKRKRGNEEVQNNGQNASEWVSDMAYIAWRDKLQHRDFIGERGFRKWISLFQELIESKGWHPFCEHKAPGFVDVVKSSTLTWWELMSHPDFHDVIYVILPSFFFFTS